MERNANCALFFILKQMKRLLLLVVLVFLCRKSPAQKDSFDVKGTIFFSDWKEKGAVKNAVVIFKVNNAVILQAPSSEDGAYHVRMKTTTEPLIITVETNSKTVASSKRVCGFLPSRDLRIIDSAVAGRIYVADLAVIPITCCYTSYPQPYYKRNSSQFISAETAHYYKLPKPDSAIAFMARMMTENPEIIVRISGRVDRRELRKKYLAISRTQVLLDTLLNRGIDPRRIKAVADMDWKNSINKVNARFTKGMKDRRRQRQMNRSGTFVILSFDFIPRPQPSPSADDED